MSRRFPVRLKKNARECPACKVGLHWHNLCGMTLKREARDRKMVYDARCPSCWTAYEVPAPR